MPGKKVKACLHDIEQLRKTGQEPVSIQILPFSQNVYEECQFCVIFEHEYFEN